jgi:hypothetical protein
MLTLKLVACAFIPAYASHYIAAEGIVVNGNKELIVVRDKQLPQSTDTGTRKHTKYLYRRDGS